MLGCVEEDGHGWLGACARWERAAVDCGAPTDSQLAGEDEKEER